jgi:DNA polymerase III subunit alpha
VNDFVHLRVHSEYSLVDSIIGYKSIVKELVESNMSACAITDNTNMFGVIKQYKAFSSLGIKPIFGVDIRYFCNDSEYGLTLLAENNDGYQSIVNLVSRAYLEFQRVNGIPIVDKEWLISENLSGVIGFPCASRGEIKKHIELGDFAQAKSEIILLQRVFGKDNFFIELQRVGKCGEELYIEKVLGIALDLSIPVIATNDVRFISSEDFDSHEIRVGIHDGYTLLDRKRVSGYTAQQYLKTSAEMFELFVDIPSALKNTLEIAKRCNVTFDLGKAVLPKFDIPKELTEDQYFSKVSYKGLNHRLEFILRKSNDKEKKLLTKNYQTRLQVEIDVISKMGFSGYFLIVADFIEWSKKNGISVGPGRGSGAGSLVAYALDITDIDPIPYGLLFERFLNPERVSMPDFDIDFCINGRDRVVDYVAEKYGRGSVSQIITYGTMAAKAVVRDVGRVLGHPYGFVDRIAKLIPNELGIKLSDACKKGTPLYDLSIEDEAVDVLLKSALKIEGTVRNVGKHAAGVVISPTYVTDFSPIYCEEGTQQLITQFDKYDVEEAGLVKFDFLGLRNLTVIDQAVKNINATLFTKREELVDIRKIPLDDMETFLLLQEAKTTGIFQLESKGMKELISKLKPDCFEDIIALVALYRPGPLGSGMVDDFVNCKHGRQQVVYPHPNLEIVLQETYGTILYQEQVMQIAQILASYSLGNADILRRAMGKKNPAEMASQRVGFIDGCLKNDIDEVLSGSIFDLMEEFANYGFNKSHSAAYALVSYQTAWLKTHYPAEFMAALLSSDMDKTDKVNIFVNECVSMSIEIHLPDINLSKYEFTVSKEGAVIYGLGAIKGIGESVIQMIVEEHESSGDFVDIFDFCKRIDIKKTNKRVLEALVYSGALDSIGEHRAQIIEIIPEAMKAAVQMQATANSGQDDLFGLSLEAPLAASILCMQVERWTLRQQLINEKSVLGMCLSGHIIDEVRFWLPYIKATPLLHLEPTHRKVPIRMVGVISKYEVRKTKKGSVIGIIEIDDGTSRLDIIIFSKILEDITGKFKIDDIIVIEGEVGLDNYSGRLKVTVKEIKHFFEALDNLLTKIDIRLSLDSMDLNCVHVLGEGFLQVSNNKVDAINVNLDILSEVSDYSISIASKCYLSKSIGEVHTQLSAQGFIDSLEYTFR